MRQQYGRDLLIMGGFDKHIWPRAKAEIEAEVRRLAPLVEEGGYIGFCDHRVPPDVPYHQLSPLPRLRAHHLGPRHQPQTTAVHLATIPGKTKPQMDTDEHR
ncbi:MAG: hypothetical protein R2851_10525 [Caldilineaceae bacterium]